MSDTVALPIPRCRHCSAAIDFSGWRPPRTQLEQDLYATIARLPGVRRAHAEDCCTLCYARQGGWRKADEAMPEPAALVQIVDERGWADFGYWDGSVWYGWNNLKIGWQPAEGEVLWWRDLELAAPPLETNS